MKKAIAMKCTRKQFKRIKNKLKTNCTISQIDYFDEDIFLVNYFDERQNNVSNIYLHSDRLKNMFEIHEKWDEKVFLEACGIEVNEVVTYKHRIHQNPGHVTINGIKYVPEVKESIIEKPVELMVNFTGWMKDDRYYKWINYFEKGVIKYGIDWTGTWVVYNKATPSEDECNRPATEQEVFEALKAEAIKRGYKNGNHKCLDSAVTERNVVNKYEFERGLLWYGNIVSANCIFKNGIWAELIPIMSIKEAEEKLNCKIVN